MNYSLKETTDILVWEVLDEEGKVRGKIVYDEFLECFHSSKDDYIGEFPTQREAIEYSLS